MVRARKKASKSRARPGKASVRRAANENTPATATLAKRPVWQGQLRLSLVSCPVAIFNATSRQHDVSFHLLNPKTHNRIRMIPTDPDEGPVERADLVKGYEIEKNRYVTVTNEELDEVKLETTHSLDIDRFVDANSIDRLYWNDPFYIVPNDKSGAEAFAVIRDAMSDTDRIALGRVVMHTRERLMAIEPRGKGMIGYTLRMANEVVDAKEAFGDIPALKPDRKMLEIAEKIIQQLEGPFEPEGFKDRYEEALRDLIRRKEKGEKPVTAPPPEATNVIDLMDALKKSLAKKKGASSARKRKAG